MWRRLGAGLSLAAALSFFGALAWINLEPAASSYKIRGVDVSAHQRTIDWPKLKADKVAFAYIKASEGGDFNDPQFVVNWRGSARAGLPHGAYHFLTQCQPGLVQAQNFIRVVPREQDALPPVVDAEHMGPCTKGPQVKDIVAELRVFLDEVELHYGKRPIIYTTQEFHDAYLVGLFPDERFWIRSLFFEPGFRKGQWTFWQYHNKGQRAGVLGAVDLNAFRGAQAEFDALMR